MAKNGESLDNSTKDLMLSLAMGISSLQMSSSMALMHSLK